MNFLIFSEIFCLLADAVFFELAVEEIFTRLVTGSEYLFESLD